MTLISVDPSLKAFRYLTRQFVGFHALIFLVFSQSFILLFLKVTQNPVRLKIGKQWDGEGKRYKENALQ